MTISKNARMVLYLTGTLLVMCALVAVSVPMYRAFCNATGFNGTARKALAAPRVATNQIMRVHFDANTNGIPWHFKADRPYLDTRVGKTAMMTFSVTNTGKVPITGRASYNILPDTMGPYFMKLQCFCFQDQTLQPGESRSFPVVYFLDPKLMSNSDTRNVPDVTLSYTFFQVKETQK